MASDEQEDPPIDSAGQAMMLVLNAEKKAEQDISECRDQARQIILDAQTRTGHIARRANERIKMQHLRCQQDVNRRISDMERDAQTKLLDMSSSSREIDELTDIVDEIATFLISDNKGETTP